MSMLIKKIAIEYVLVRKFILILFSIKLRNYILDNRLGSVL